MTYCYDIECYSNLFCITFIDIKNTDNIFQFTIFEDINELEELSVFMNSVKCLIGYNNLYYDDLLLKYLLQKVSKYEMDTNSLTKRLFNVSQEIISNQGYERPDSVKYLKNTYLSIDLMSILAFNKLKIGLKQVAINFRWPRIQDLPIHWSSYIKNIEEANMILNYNKNDTQITIALFNKLEPEIRLRNQIGNTYGIKILNSSNSDIGSKLLNKLYSESTGLPLSEFKDLRTERYIIPFKNIISDKIKFTTPNYQKLYDFLYNYVLEVGKSDNKTQDKGIYKLIHNGKRSIIGTGGLHSDNPPKVYRSTETTKIITADVGSYYPTLLVNETCVPKHLDNNFLKLYENIIKERLLSKKEEGSKSVKAEALKIVLNSVFGKLGFPYFWLYDLQALYKITINGQLFLLMLIEELEQAGFEIIMENTDGFEAIVPDNKRELYDFICGTWEFNTGFILEYDTYKTMVIKDCNNYISITENGKVKEKGTFLTNRSKISIVDELKRAFDMPIISEALFLYFIERIPIEQTIKGDKDIYNFCTSQKAGSEFEIEYHYIKNDNNNIPTKFIDKMQKTNRYYISTKGGVLLKKKNNKYTSMAAGLTINILNNYIEKDIIDYNIDYNYYISECNKIINIIMNNFQQSLF